MTFQRVALYFLLLIVAVAAAVLSFDALRGLALLCGFTPELAWLLPVTIDAGAAASSIVWLGTPAPGARTYGRSLALVLLTSSVGGNALGHGLSAYGVKPQWGVVVGVSAIAPAVLGALVHLVVLAGRRQADVEAKTDETGLVTVEAPSGDESPTMLRVRRVNHEHSPTTLYRLWDDGDALLYVGITMDMASRMATHRRKKEWWSEVAEVTVEEYPTRSEALAAETAAIAAEAPRYNQNGGQLLDAFSRWNEAEPTAADRDKMRPIALPASDADLIADVREWAVDRAAIGADRPSRDDMIEAYSIGAPRARKIRRILGWADEPEGADREPTEAAR